MAHAIARVALRTASRPLIAPALAAPIAAWARPKTSTGIVGLAVEPEAKPVLLDLYAKTLTLLEEVPAESEYRKVVEGYTKARVAALKASDDLMAIEKAIGGGQLEQLIQQAQDELTLIPKLIAVRAFDPYDGGPAEEILGDLKRCAPAAVRLLLASEAMLPSTTHTPHS